MITPNKNAGLIYLSGPMTGYVEFNFPTFNHVSRVLREAGFSVFNPAEMGVHDGWEWSDYLRRDIKFMLECMSVILLPGYQNSRGASLEEIVARKLGYPIWELGNFFDLPENGLCGSQEILDVCSKLSVAFPARS